MHQFIGQNFTKPCCEYVIDSKKTPIDFWNSKELATMRKELENGIWPVGCKTCKLAEKNNQLSLRQRSLKEYKVLQVPKIEYIDVRLSNKCNFKCRTCEPKFSSRIAKESKVHNLKEYYGYELDKNYIEHSEQITQDIIKNLPNIKKLMFTGGEPTYQPQFYKILDIIIEEDFTDIFVCITTNASMITDKLINYVSKIKNVHFTLSIDAVGKLAEYVRHGTVWYIVDSNIKRVLELKTSTTFNTVISAYSLHGLEDFVDYISDNEQDQDGADMYICKYPKHLHPCVLPINMRTQLTTTVENCIIKLSQSSRHEDYSGAIQVLSELKSLLDIKYDDKIFKKFTKRLDTIRNEQI